MRKSRFTKGQIVAILQESAARAKTGALIRRHPLGAAAELATLDPRRHAAVRDALTPPPRHG